MKPIRTIVRECPPPMTREQHVRDFAALLDQVHSAPQALVFVYVGKSGPNPDRTQARLRGLDADDLRHALAAVLTAALSSGVIGLDDVSQAVAEAVIGAEEIAKARGVRT